jgi:Phage tail assembly chaperone protein
MMSYICLHVVDGAVASVLDGPADGAVAVGEAWVSPRSLMFLSDDELAEIALVRARRVHPTIDTATHTETGYQPEALPDGSWAYVMQSRPLTEDELSGARERAKATIVQQRDSLLATAIAKLDRHRNQRDFGIPTTLTDAQARECAQYAQDLRDLPATVTDPATVAWPPNPLA